MAREPSTAPEGVTAGGGEVSAADYLAAESAPAGCFAGAAEEEAELPADVGEAAETLLPADADCLPASLTNSIEVEVAAELAAAGQAGEQGGGIDNALPASLSTGLAAAAVEGQRKEPAGAAEQAEQPFKAVAAEEQDAAEAGTCAYVTAEGALAAAVAADLRASVASSAASSTDAPEEPTAAAAEADEEAAGRDSLRASVASSAASSAHSAEDAAEANSPADMPAAAPADEPADTFSRSALAEALDGEGPYDDLRASVASSAGSAEAAPQQQQQRPVEASSAAEEGHEPAAEQVTEAAAREEAAAVEDAVRSPAMAAPEAGSSPLTSDSLCLHGSTNTLLGPGERAWGSSGWRCI